VTAAIPFSLIFAAALSGRRHIPISLISRSSHSERIIKCFSSRSRQPFTAVFGDPQAGGRGRVTDWRVLHDRDSQLDDAVRELLAQIGAK
jgi:hypothetical protein